MNEWETEDADISWHSSPFMLQKSSLKNSEDLSYQRAVPDLTSLPSENNNKTSATGLRHANTSLYDVTDMRTDGQLKCVFLCFLSNCFGTTRWHSMSAWYKLELKSGYSTAKSNQFHILSGTLFSKAGMSLSMMTDIWLEIYQRGKNPMENIIVEITELWEWEQLYSNAECR